MSCPGAQNKEQAVGLCLLGCLTLVPANRAHVLQPDSVAATMRAARTYPSDDAMQTVGLEFLCNALLGESQDNTWLLLSTSVDLLPVLCSLRQRHAKANQRYLVQLINLLLSRLAKPNSGAFIVVARFPSPEPFSLMEIAARRVAGLTPQQLGLRPFVFFREFLNEACESLVLAAKPCDRAGCLGCYCNRHYQVAVKRGASDWPLLTLCSVSCVNKV